MDQRHLQVAFFLIILAAVLVLSYEIIAPFLGATVLAAVFAVIFYPLFRRTAKLVRYEGLAAFLVVAVVTILILTPLGVLGYRIFQQASGLYVGFSNAGGTDGVATSVLSAINRVAAQLHLPGISLADVNQYARQVVSWFVSNLGPLFSGVAQAGLTLLLSLLAFFYFLKDGRRLREYLIGLIPLEAKHAEQILDRLHQAVHSVVVATLLVVVVQGILAGIGFSIFGVPNAAFWGLMAAITALIPSAGTSFVTAPVIIYLYFTSSFGNFLGMVIWGVLTAIFIDNVFAPNMMKRGTRIHQLVVLLGVMGGIALFGPIGFIIGPLVLALLYALLEIYPEIITGKRTGE